MPFCKKRLTSHSYPIIIGIRRHLLSGVQPYIYEMFADREMIRGIIMRKQFLKGSAAVLALSCLFGTVSAIPVTAADAIFEDSFESGDGAWTGRGGAKVAVNTDKPYSGSHALYVSGRTDAWNGAEKDMSGILTTGSTYSISAVVCYEGSAQSVNFMLSLAYKDASGTVNYDHIANAETISGFYVQLAKTDYQLPADATDPVLYVETEKGSTSFYLDDVICMEGGTVIDGPQPVKFTLGDADYDGAVNAADFSIAKCIAITGESEKAVRKAADVDCSGAVDMADIVWYAKFLTGEVQEYPEPVIVDQSDGFAYDTQLQYHSCPQGYTEQINNAAQRGQVIEEHYQGPKGTNTCYVYLPVGYDESQKYNIFYLMHGGGENEKTLFHQDDTMIQNIMDHMIANGDMPPTIVVTPTWNQTGADGFWSEFREMLVPYIEGKYATYAASGSLEDLQASRYHRAYGGFSMGSVSTWGVLLNCLDICAYYMPLSGEYKVSGLSYEQQAQLVQKAIQDSGFGMGEYFIMAATGTKDMAQPQMTPMINELRKLPELVETSDLTQGNFYYMLVDGKQHWWGDVRHYIYDILPYFFHEHQNL